MSNYSSAETLFNEGTQLFEQGSSEEACKKYEQATQIKPDFVEAFLKWATCLIRLDFNEDAISKCKKAIELDSNSFEAYFLWGTALYFMLQYDEALKRYEQALSIKHDYRDALYNATFIYYKRGQYKAARQLGRKTCDVYEQVLKNPETSDDVSTYLWYGMLLQSIMNDNDEADRIWKQGLTLDPSNTSILRRLAGLHFEMKSAAIETDDNTAANRRESHYKAMDYFRRAKSILQTKAKAEDNADVYYQLGQLYQTAEDSENAKANLMTALSKRNDDYFALSALGAVYMNDEEFQKAISCFKSAVALDPDNLDMQSNLARAYLKAGFKDMAEQSYRKIFNITPYHMDAVIGLGDVYFAMGQDARSRDDMGGADDFFAQAFEYYTKALKLDTKECELASRRLNKKEISLLFYSKGYTKVSLFELRGRKDNKSLTEALDDFKKVSPDTPLFFRASRAIRKLQERLSPHRDVSDSWASLFTLSLSSVVFIVAQLAFFVGRPIYERLYVIDSPKLERFIQANYGTQQQMMLKLSSLKNQTFHSLEQCDKFLTTLLGSETAEKIKLADLITWQDGKSFVGNQLLEPGYYALITFGALIFIIASLYLRQISKLKFGAIELEKSSNDNITQLQPLLIE